ncbi:hypothetical protein EHI8A_010850 [Entamoeba histolytica HM-1:IMSS-B]|uniref:Uncharacterized protein n=4 Tax=Entamoeba TaxID=5758 RepID=M3TAD3_ENTH1|nr:hypothetical protein ENU1_068670 [Entamoeba nuttalli P19]EKE41082.1 hypothetical protein ENU1_068670 [Entamoeba nuttalli P19]EMD47177.1 Hypothetical protein EHI5A_028460 [Entamoeba histolytica KU27]EMH72143.1 hypothetical protein EHI8A_010850 [Entamoeba histolytica HM-1:IMSS-B]|eukprot:XP_008856589.1 hypothetical protein ENU1_068670 [Entamoeba nuttalli P19]
MLFVVFFILFFIGTIANESDYQINDELDDFEDIEFELMDVSDDIEDDNEYEEEEEFDLGNDAKSAEALVVDVERTLAKMSSFPYSDEFM